MSSTPFALPLFRVWLVPLAGWLVGLGVVMAAFAATGGGASAVPTALLAPLLVAAVVPALAGRAWGSREALARDAAHVLAPGVALFLLAAPRGLGAAAALAAIVSSFALLGAGVRALLGGGRAGEGLAPQVLATLLLLALVGGVFAADPLVEGAPGAGQRDALIAAVVGWNPMLVIGARVLGVDLMHAEIMYARLSSIARFYAYGIPGWGWVAAMYAGTGFVAWVLGSLVRPGPRS